MHTKSAPALILEEGIHHPGQGEIEGSPGRKPIHVSISTIGKLWALCLLAILADLWMGFGFSRSVGGQAGTAGLFHALGMIFFAVASGITRWYMLTRRMYPANSWKPTLSLLTALGLVLGVFTTVRLSLTLFETSLNLVYAIYITTGGAVFGGSSGYILSYLFWRHADMI